MGEKAGCADECSGSLCGRGGEAADGAEGTGAAATRSGERAAPRGEGGSCVSGVGPAGLGTGSTAGEGSTKAAGEPLEGSGALPTGAALGASEKAVVAGGACDTRKNSVGLRGRPDERLRAKGSSSGRWQSR